MAKKILIIDDDRELCEEMAEILGTEGYTVDTAHDGFQGQDRIKNNMFDLILLDFKMPGLDGAQMLKKIKSNSNPPKTILISGRSFLEQALEKEGVADLADAVVSKPFDIEALLSKIKSLI